LINRVFEEISKIKTRKITYNGEGEAGDLSVGEDEGARVNM
jgi:hypothetical protein